MGAVTCPAGYNYLGVSCVKVVPDPIPEGSFNDAKIACGTDDMVYLPDSREQSVVFRAALMEKVTQPFSPGLPKN